MLFSATPLLTSVSPKDLRPTLAPAYIPSKNSGSLRRVLYVLGFGGSAYLAWRLYKYYIGNKNAEVLKKLITSKLNQEPKSIMQNQVSPAGKNMDTTKYPNAAYHVQSILERDLNNNLSPPFSERRVVLHLCPRGFFTPSVSPFPLKLETFLRIAKISYEADFSLGPGDRNVPWMTIDDEEISESRECIEKLCDYFNVNLEAKALNSRKIASRLVDVMLEHHVYWGIALWRWVYDEARTLPHIQPLSESAAESLADTSSAVSKAAWYHGLGRLMPEQVRDIILKDLEDLSAALGKHNYFLGESPGMVDCGAFAMLSQMIWNMPGSPYEGAIKQYSNLVDFVLRMRDNFWKDWDHQLSIRGSVQNSVETLLPGSEFLQKRQINSDSSQWDSKATSTATLKIHHMGGVDYSGCTTATGSVKNFTHSNTSFTAHQTSKNQSALPSFNSPFTYQESQGNEHHASYQSNLGEVRSMYQNYDDQPTNTCGRFPIQDDRMTVPQHQQFPLPANTGIVGHENVERPLLINKEPRQTFYNPLEYEAQHRTENQQSGSPQFQGWQGMNQHSVEYETGTGNQQPQLHMNTEGLRYQRQHQDMQFAQPAHEQSTQEQQRLQSTNTFTRNNVFSMNHADSMNQNRAQFTDSRRMV